MKKQLYILLLLLAAGMGAMIALSCKTASQNQGSLTGNHVRAVRTNYPAFTGVGVTNTTAVYGAFVYRFPLPDAEIIKYLLPNEKVIIFYTNNGWYRVVIPDGRIGWISTNATGFNSAMLPYDISKTVTAADIRLARQLTAQATNLWSREKFYSAVDAETNPIGIVFTNRMYNPNYDSPVEDPKWLQAVSNLNTAMEANPYAWNTLKELIDMLSAAADSGEIAAARDAFNLCLYAVTVNTNTADWFWVQLAWSSYTPSLVNQSQQSLPASAQIEFAKRAIERIQSSANYGKTQARQCSDLAYLIGSSYQDLAIKAADQNSDLKYKYRVLFSEWYKYCASLLEPYISDPEIYKIYLSRKSECDEGNFPCDDYIRNYGEYTND